MMQDEDNNNDESQMDGDEVQDQDQDEDENQDFYHGAMNIDDVNAIQDHRDSESENEANDRELLVMISM